MAVKTDNIEYEWIDEPCISNLFRKPDTLDEIRRSFVKFINHKNGKPDSEADDAISFWEGFLLRYEGYKADKFGNENVFNKANSILKWNEWGQPNFNTAEITDRFIEAIDLKENNLVHRHQKNFFKSRLINDATGTAKQALINIYQSANKSDDEKNAFEFARQRHIFGGKYDLLAFLFFLKDKNRFLPVRSSLFDRSFDILDIDFEMKYSASWSNYQKYIGIAEFIRRHLITYTTHDVTLLDAHTFLWVIQPNGTRTEGEFLRFHEYIINAYNASLSEDDSSKTSHDSNIDYIQLLKKNKELGDAGEAFVLKSERRKLSEFNIHKEPKWVARYDDGAGYDIISYDKNGNEIFIEVKTTTQGLTAPFYFTSNELEKSTELTNLGKKYLLFRVFNFDLSSQNGKIWIHEGNLGELDYLPTSYICKIQQLDVNTAYRPPLNH